MSVNFILLGLMLPFLSAGLLLLLPQRFARFFGVIVVTESLAVFGLATMLWKFVSEGEVYVFSYTWIPSLNMSFSLCADRLAIFFMALVGLIGAAIAQYSRQYFEASQSRRFWVLFSAFQGAMLGIPIAHSLIVLFIFWEMTTIISALLIALDDKNPRARSAAIQAFLVTGMGGLSLLSGIVLLGHVSGSYELSVLQADVPKILENDLHQVALVLILIGAFTKSAQFPFHFWLPGAMAAPTPISAYLHSATMVKAGIILISRMFPIFSSSPLWEPILGNVGMITFVLASWNAFRASDMKRVLAFSTVSYLGVLTTIYGYSHGREVQGELLHIANHTFYKSSLFLLLGWFEKVSGTRDINLLDKEKWFRRHPLGCLLFCLAGLAVVGGPFLLGYTSKALYYDIVFANEYTIWKASLVLIGSCLTVAYTMKLIVATLWGKEEPGERTEAIPQHYSHWFLTIPTLLLLPQVIGGIFPDYVSRVFAEPGRELIGGLAFWHSLDAKFVLKVSIFIFGIGLYFLWRFLARFQIAKGFESYAHSAGMAILKGFGKLSLWLRRGSEALQISLTMTATLIFVLALSPFSFEVLKSQMLKLDLTTSHHFIISSSIIICSSLALLFVKNRLVIILLVTLSSYGLALHYVQARAPDLALTQFLADTVGLILILLVFTKIPPLMAFRSKPFDNWVIALTSIVIGLASGLLVLLSNVQPSVFRVGEALLAKSLPEGRGSNAVNVILVDFRAIDTFGEIIVLGLAATGVMALLPGFSLQGSDFRDDSSKQRSPFISSAVKIILPMTLMFSVYLFLRGHNEPGGGFIAALVATTAVVLHSLAFGTQQTYRNISPFVLPLLWGGILISAASGAVALFLEEPYLKHIHTGYFSTVLLFDLGVFAAVLGSSLIALGVLGGKSK